MGLLNSGTKYGVDVSRVVIAGDSSGGNLAAAVTRYLASVAERHCSRQYLSAQVKSECHMLGVNFRLVTLSIVHNNINSLK